MSEPKKQPVKKFYARGGLSFAVWCNDQQQQDGTLRPVYSGTLQKRYKDKKGVWQNSDSLFPEDWPKVEALMRKAFDYVVLIEREEANEDIPI